MAKTSVKRLFSMRYFEVEAWPVLAPNEVLCVPNQQPALGGFDHGPQTRLRSDEVFRHPEYSKFDVRHEHQVSQLARFAGEEVRRFIKIEEFPAYVKMDGASLFLNSKGSYAESALRRIAKARSMGWHQRMVDVRAFHEEFRHSATRAYFGSIKRNNLHAVALLGPDVHLSPEFARHLGRGDLLSSLSVRLTWEGHLREVFVSQKNLVMFFMGNEHDAVSFAAHVTAVLAPFAGYQRTQPDDLSQGEVTAGEDEETEKFPRDDL